MRRATGLFISSLLLTASVLNAQAPEPVFNGLDLNLGNISQLSHAQTRSISAENPTGEKGKGGMATEGTNAKAARDLGQGWKVSPSVMIQPKQVFTLAEIQGSGAIQHIRMAPRGTWRFSILRMYWDGEREPSVEVPVGDFFANGWGTYAPISSLPVCVSPSNSFNSFWQMPFRKSARITMENLDEKPVRLTYQIDYTLTDVPAQTGYFHAQFRRTNPLPYKSDYVILDGAKGWGQYVGTYMAWGTHSTGWWGEGEVKFFIDGDGKFPTICGTGAEDYFCGGFGFENRTTHQYQEYTTPYAGLAQVIRPDGLWQSQLRFGMYRWHIQDPVRFEKDLKVTIQALGWRPDGRYLPLQDDIASVAYWYQAEPHAPFPPLPDKDALEVK
jgi:hypothetical protein